MVKRSLSVRVLVRHSVYGVEKWVLRKHLPSLAGTAWERVAPPKPEQPKKRPARRRRRPPQPSPVVEAPTVEPAAEPDTTTKEE